MKIPFYLLLLPLIFSSCLTLKERYTINKNGSGDLRITLDFTQARLFKADSVKGLVAIRDRLIQIPARLEKIKGVSKAEILVENDNHTYTLTLSFEKLSSLNQALNELYNPSADSRQVYVAYENNVLRRTQPPMSIAQLQKQMKHLTGNTQMPEENLLKNIQYSLFWSFKREVAVVYSNSEVLFNQEPDYPLAVRTPVQNLLAPNKPFSFSIVLK